jgi:hypothetical protein
MGRVRTRTCLALAACAACGLSAAPAQATYHLMKITEVGQTTNDYVVLQMYAPGQNLVAGKSIRTYNAFGLVQDTFTFPGNVAFGDTQRTIYVARDDGLSPGSPDFTSPNLVVTNVGAVCYGASFGPNEAIDCMSYGPFPGVAGGNPSPMGTPAPTAADGQAFHRSLTPGCPTFLEDADDTNNSAADFTIGAQAPRNNATTPTEKPCDTTSPNTKIKKRPKNRSGDDSPTFKFKSTEAGSTFKCKLDRKKFKKCKSPKTFHGLDPGKHTFKVEAIDADGNVDSTPAKDKFKILP